MNPSHNRPNRLIYYITACVCCLILYTTRSSHSTTPTPHPKPTILLIDEDYPRPDRDSASLRQVNIIRVLLRNGYDVHFRTVYEKDGVDRYRKAVQVMGVTTLGDQPADSWNLTTEHGCRYAAAIVSRRDPMHYAHPILKAGCPTLPVIYDTVDVHFLREARVHIGSTQQSDPHSLDWNFDRMNISNVQAWIDSHDPTAVTWAKPAREVELGLMLKADATWIVSPAELAALGSVQTAARIAIAPNLYDVSPHRPQNDCWSRQGILFVGNMDHAPNQRAMESLVHEVLPLLLTELPRRTRAHGLKVHIVGSGRLPDSLLAKLNQSELVVKHVVMHGHLSDDALRRMYASVRVAVAPLLTGAGVKGKVNQAMLLGTPVVSTPIAVEGMHAEDGVHCMVGRTPLEFAQKVVEVYEGCGGDWWRLVVKGRELMETHFSVEAVEKVMMKSLSDVGVRQSAQPLDRHGNIGQRSVSNWLPLKVK